MPISLSYSCSAHSAIMAWILRASATVSAVTGLPGSGYPGAARRSLRPHREAHAASTCSAHALFHVLVQARRACDFDLGLRALAHRGQHGAQQVVVLGGHRGRVPLVALDLALHGLRQALVEIVDDEGDMLDARAQLGVHRRKSPRGLPRHVRFAQVA
jgi:hypothetical protein